MSALETQGRMPRHQLNLPCQVVRERDFRLIADRLDNLSLTGLSVSPAEPVLTGERVIVSFRLPREARWIDAEASVMRVVHGRRPGEQVRSLGLLFDKLDESLRAAIARELQRTPVAPPGRSRRDEQSERVGRVLAWFSSRLAPSWES